MGRSATGEYMCVCVCVYVYIYIYDISGFRRSVGETVTLLGGGVDLQVVADVSGQHRSHLHGVQEDVLLDS